MRDRVVSPLVGVAALLVYVRTLYPGVGGGGDSVKFQYLGHALGTAHPPGYPLYVLIGHLFSWVPIGTIAHRANLMSACCGAVAAALTYLAIRELGARRLAAVAGALGLAFGAATWSKAVVAEVYTLAGALTAGCLWLVLRWMRTRRDGTLYTAIAMAALAFANHLSILFVAPALAAAVLLTDWRRALRPRVLAVALLIVAAGASLYGFIWLRTVQASPALEARASTLSELLGVVTARRFAGDMFHYSSREIVNTRLPEAAQLLYRELGPAGAALAAIGLGWLALRRWRVAVLVGGALAGPVFLVMNVFGDMEGFLTPAFIACWMLAGAGAHVLSQGAARLSNRGIAATVAVAALWLPAGGLINNYSANDHHRRDFEARYLAAMFQRLPDNAAIVTEQYGIDQLILYKLLGEDEARRGIRPIAANAEAVRAHVAAGQQAFAFETGRKTLEAFGFVFQPIELDEAMPDYLRGLKPGTIVAIAAVPGAAFGFSPADSDSLRSIGASTLFYGLDRRAYGAIGVVGASGAVESLDGGGVDLTIEQGRPIGATGVTSPVRLEVGITGDRASIAVAGADVARTPQGFVLAALTPQGRVMETKRVDSTKPVRVPIDMSLLPIAVVSETSVCTPIGNAGWKDVSASLSPKLVLRIDNYRTFDSTFDVYLASAQPVAPAKSETTGTGTPASTITEFDLSVAADRDRLTRALAADALPAPEALMRGAFVARLHLAVNDQGQNQSSTFLMQGTPSFAIARATVDLNNPLRATVCAVR